MAVGLGIFYFWPMVRTFYFSFTKWGPFGGGEWTGLDNYRRMASEPDVWHALLVSLGYTGIMLLGIPIAAVIANLLNIRNLRFLTAYRTLFFLPVVTMPVAVAIVWRALFNSTYGPINYLLSIVGIPKQNWLSEPGLALISLGIVGIWMSLGQQIIILLAGLQGIPRDIYEAAELDGVNWLQRYRYITLPLLTPTIFFLTVLSVVGTLQMFDLLYVMIDPGNPALQSTRTIVYLFYQEGFLKNDKGFAAAIAFLLAAIILLLTMIQFRLQKRWVHY